MAEIIKKSINKKSNQSLKMSTHAIFFQVTQIACNSVGRAPDGCLQYITDTTSTGIIKTFNFDQGVHLANQFQQICFRYVNNSLSFFHRIKPEILVQAWLPQLLL